MDNAQSLCFHVKILRYSNGIPTYIVYVIVNLNIVNVGL